MCVEPTSRSCVKRDFFVRELDTFCNTLNIKELCIIRKKSNENIIKELSQSIKNINKWSGSRICIIKGVTKVENKDDRRGILNDFHILPTSGHAGIQRMTNNLKRYFYWPGMDKDIQ